MSKIITRTMVAVLAMLIMCAAFSPAVFAKTETTVEGVDVTRLAGTSRIDTAVDISNEVSSIVGADEIKSVVIASGENYAAKMVAMLANDGTYNNTQILKPESVATMEKRYFTRSANGGSFMQVLALRYKKNLYGESELYYHTGNSYGVLALMSYNPATKDGVVVITTGASATRDSQGVYAVCSKITEYIYKNVI